MSKKNWTLALENENHGAYILSNDADEETEVAVKKGVDGRIGIVLKNPNKIIYDFQSVVAGKPSEEVRWENLNKKLLARINEMVAPQLKGGDLRVVCFRKTLSDKAPKEVLFWYRADADGTFKPVSWDTEEIVGSAEHQKALPGVAAKRAAEREAARAAKAAEPKTEKPVKAEKAPKAEKPAKAEKPVAPAAPVTAVDKKKLKGFLSMKGETPKQAAHG